MGNVIRLHASRCPCGWKIPSVSIVVAERNHIPPTDAAMNEVYFECPECGQPFIQPVTNDGVEKKRPE
jgi:DNA-directed RNA polymerase subunit RPC12/RpoP